MRKKKKKNKGNIKKEGKENENISDCRNTYTPLAIKRKRRRNKWERKKRRGDKRISAHSHWRWAWKCSVYEWEVEKETNASPRLNRTKGKWIFSFTQALSGYKRSHCEGLFLPIHGSYNSMYVKRACPVLSTLWAFETHSFVLPAPSLACFDIQ